MTFLHDTVSPVKSKVTTLTERGQVSVPAAVRKHLRLSPGTRLRWEELSEGECLVTVERAGPGAGARAMLGYAAEFRKPRRTAEWMRELRDGERV